MSDWQDVCRFALLRKKLDIALTPEGTQDDPVAINLTKWDVAFLAEALDELLLVKEGEQ